MYTRFFQYCQQEQGYTGFDYRDFEGEDDVVTRLASLKIHTPADGMYLAYKYSHCLAFSLLCITKFSRNNAAIIHYKNFGGIQVSIPESYDVICMLTSGEVYTYIMPNTNATPKMTSYYSLFYHDRSDLPTLHLRMKG